LEERKMTKKLVSVLLLAVLLIASITAFAALPMEDTENPLLNVKTASFDEEEGVLTVTVANTSDKDVSPVILFFDTEDKNVTLEGLQYDQMYGYPLNIDKIDARTSKTVKIPAKIEN
jgi:hypothetical protein